LDGGLQFLNKNHIWTKKETYIALKAYLDGLTRKEAELVAKSNGIKTTSFIMRMSNFEYLFTNGKKGLSKIKRLEQEVYNEYIKYKLK